VGEKFCFNVDGMLDVGADEGIDECGLSKDERIELVRYRCLVTHSRPHEGDIFPYDYKFIEDLAMRSGEKYEGVPRD